jgi:hypothetical protein
MVAVIAVVGAYIVALIGTVKGHRVPDGHRSRTGLTRSGVVVVAILTLRNSNNTHLCTIGDVC